MSEDDCGTGMEVGARAGPDGLTRGLPGAVGVDAVAIDAFLENAAEADLSLHSVVLHRHGRVVFECYWWPYRATRPRVMHSVAKSFTACAIGMALEEGRFALSDTVVGFFPEELPQSVSDNLASMTVEDLLTMRTGHAEETSGSRWRGLTGSWTEAFFEIPVVFRPGTVYTYTSAASYMLSAILTTVTGQTLHQYLRPRLFEPLGIERETWDLGPDGVNPGGNGLSCTTLDMLKLGVLHIQKGVWNGRRLLTERWVFEATRARSASGYGYHWMTGPNGTYAAMGVFGQMVVVFPAHGATLAITSAVNGENACSEILLPLIHKHFPAALHDNIRDDSEAEARLLRRGKAAANVSPLVSVTQPSPERSGESTYEIMENSLGITQLRLNLSGDVCTVFLTDASGEHTIRAGIGRWIEGETDVPGRDLHHGYELRPGRVVAGARWLDPNTLEMQWIFAETAFRDRVVCRFEADRIHLARRVNVNSGSLTHPELQGRRRAP